jgi:hypothetical protein
MRRLLIIAVVVSCGASALAADFRLSATSYFRGRVRPAVGDTVDDYPFYELVDLSARDLGVAGLSLHASLWGRIALADVIPPDERATGEVNLLTLEYRAPIKTRFEGLRLRLGRQFVFAMPSTVEQLDGAMVGYRHPGGFDLQAFGGALTGIRFLRQPWPVVDDQDEYGPNWVAGGRVGYRYLDLAALGVSYGQKRYDGRPAFNELGWDALLGLHERISLFGAGSVELTAERLKTVRVGLRAELLHHLEASAGYRFASPDLYIPRTSIFAVFSDEVHQEAFVEAYWRVRRWLALTAEVAGRFYGESCTDSAMLGTSACHDEQTANGSLRADLRLGPQGVHRMTFEFERVGAPEGGYTRWRGATRLALPGALSAVVDLDLTRLDKPTEDAVIAREGDHLWAFSAAGYLGRSFLDAVRLLAGGRAMVSPLLSHAVAFLVRVEWVFDRYDGGPVAVRRNSALATGRLGGGSR